MALTGLQRHKKKVYNRSSKLIFLFFKKISLHDNKNRKKAARYFA